MTDFRPEVEIWPHRACAIKWPNRRNFYRNSSIIVDVAMGQMPRCRERISSCSYL